MIKILYFAALREHLGLAEEQLELPEGVGTVADLRQRLRVRGGVWSQALHADEPLMSAVNQALVGPSAPVRDGDEVAFFPPVTGG